MIWALLKCLGGIRISAGEQQYFSVRLQCVLTSTNMTSLVKWGAPVINSNQPLTAYNVKKLVACFFFFFFCDDELLSVCEARPPKRAKGKRMVALLQLERWGFVNDHDSRYFGWDSVPDVFYSIVSSCVGYRNQSSVPCKSSSWSTKHNCRLPKVGGARQIFGLIGGQRMATPW